MRGIFAPLGSVLEERKKSVKIVIIRSPRLLAPLLGRLFGVNSNPKKEK